MTTAINNERLNAFVQHAIGDLAAGFGGVMVSLGHKSGIAVSQRVSCPSG